MSQLEAVRKGRSEARKGRYRIARGVTGDFICAVIACGIRSYASNIVVWPPGEHKPIRGRDIRRDSGWVFPAGIRTYATDEISWSAPSCGHGINVSVRPPRGPAAPGPGAGGRRGNRGCPAILRLTVASHRPIDGLGDPPALIDHLLDAAFEDVRAGGRKGPCRTEGQIFLRAFAPRWVDFRAIFGVVLLASTSVYVPSSGRLVMRPSPIITTSVLAKCFLSPSQHSSVTK